MMRADRHLEALDAAGLDQLARRCDEILRLVAELREQLGDTPRRAKRRTRRRAVAASSVPKQVVRISGVSTAAQFLRERGAIVMRREAGRYWVNGNEVEASDILSMANAKRLLAGMPLFEIAA